VKGLTLVELLIAMTLGILLLSGIFSTYLFSQKIHQQQTQLINQLETMRVISEILSNEIKIAGFIGCGRLDNHFPIENHTGYAVTPADILAVRHDSFTVLHASLPQSKLIEDMIFSTVLYVSMEVLFKESDILIISDCYSVAVCQIRTVVRINDHVQKIILLTPLKHVYRRNAQTSILERNSYFVEQGSLYKRDIHNKKIALADNILRLQIEFIPPSGVQMTYFLPSKIGFIYAALR
jgi:hypothetical protein